jgi:uncharacterized protein YhdP
LHSLVLRPLLVVLTLAMLVIALFQSAGRLGFMLLDEGELAINQWLSGQRLQVTGLEGSWRLLNPVVRVDRVDLPAGYLADVAIELDWLESLVRNRFVARRLVVGDAHVLVERSSAGQWRMVGTAAGGEFDLSGLLYHSDELRLSGSIALRREGDKASPTGEVVAPIRIDYTATNRGGMHRHELALSNLGRDCDDPCRALAQYQVQEGLWPFWDEALQLQADIKHFRLPKPLLGMSALEVESLGVKWQRLGDDSGGWLSARVDGLELPADVVLAGRVEAQVEGHLDVHQAVIDELEVRQSAHIEHVSEQTPVASALRLPVIRLRKDLDLLQLWSAGLDLGEVSEFLRKALQGMELPRRWLEELNLRAQLLNLRGYLRPATGEIGYAGTLADLQTEGYKGVPFMRGGAGELMGFRRGAQLKLNGQDMLLQFRETFTDKWQMPYMQGVVQAWFKGGYLGLRGLNLRAQTPFTNISGGFAVARTVERYEQRLTLLLNIDAVEIEQARVFVPYKIPVGLAQWINDGPRAGLLSGLHFGYHGQTHVRPNELGRRIELVSRISEGRVQYHADWPEITELSGRVEVAGSTVRIRVDDGLSIGARLAGTRVVLRDKASYADIELDAQVGTQETLEFVRATPLRDSLTFIGPDWTGAGKLRLQGDLHVPLGDKEGDKEGEIPDALAVDLNIELQLADLEMPDYRLTVNDLDGRLRYRYTNTQRGSDIKASLFWRDATLAAASDADTMTLSFTGHAGHEDVLAIIAMEDRGLFAGSMDFVADLHVPVSPDRFTWLDITSDLQGLAVSLPGEFAKSPELARPLAVGVQFLDAYQVMSFDHGSAQGWLHTNDGLLRGAIGFDRAPLGQRRMLELGADYLLLTGRMDHFTLEEVVPDDGDNSDAPIAMRLADLRVGHIDLDEFRVDDALLNGDITASGFEINVASETLTGDLRLNGDEPLLVDLQQVQFPASETDDVSDPLQPELIAELPAAVVTIDSLRVGEDDYGRWKFTLEPTDDGVLVANIDAVLRGVNVLAPEGVMWNAQRNESHFKGELNAGNLLEVLPLWDYAPSLETKSASMVGDLRWAGSPANVDLDLLIGEADVRADEGRFVDVDSGGGAMRLFSLMNLSNIFRRMRGDFSDVTDKGVSFDKLKGKVAFNAGTLRFVEPMKVNGTGSSFEVAGTVDLVDGVLDNEMIVTLPVSKNLPWYAAYIALANPLVGAGIILGERVLRKPIEQFSSAKYEISGTLDEPEVNLVNVFDTSMKSGESEAGEDREEIEEAPAVEGVVPTEVVAIDEAVLKPELEPELELELEPELEPESKPEPVPEPEQ